MAGPRVRQEAEVLKNLSLQELQEWRKASLTAFSELLRTAPIQAQAQTEPAAFSKLVRLAVQDYGVKQTVLAESLGVSSAAVSRWMYGQSLPPAYGRDAILEAIAAIIAQALERVGADDGPLLGGTI